MVSLGSEKPAPNRCFVYELWQYVNYYFRYIHLLESLISNSSQATKYILYMVMDRFVKFVMDMTHNGDKVRVGKSRKLNLSRSHKSLAIVWISHRNISEIIMVIDFRMKPTCSIWNLGITHISDLMKCFNFDFRRCILFITLNESLWGLQLPLSYHTMIPISLTLKFRWGCTIS